MDISLLKEIYTQGSIIGFTLGATALLIGYGTNALINTFKSISN